MQCVRSYLENGTVEVKSWVGHLQACASVSPFRYCYAT